MSRLFLAAGEASGDLHGSLLARALLKADPSLEIAGVGGEAMESAGVRLVQRSEEMGVTGFWEVIQHLPRIRRILHRVYRDLIDFEPDLFVPIDYPDFNMRLGARVQKAGIPVVYYISPQVWAWRSGRVRQLARFVRRMVVIFPFEEKLYREAGVPVSYVGHPLVDLVRPERDRSQQRRRVGIGDDEPLVVLMPGSRSSEIARILPVFLQTHRILRAERPDIRWAIALAPGLERDCLVRHGLGVDSPVVRERETYELVAAADLVLTASGTATLEAALLRTPMIVVYRMHPLTWHLARSLVRIPHISMANLLAGKRLVPEFLQNEAQPERLAREVAAWIDDPERRGTTSAELGATAAKLGGGGAADRAASILLEEIDR
jgi:lipid-A-disaccharide synthase